MARSSRKITLHLPKKQTIQLTVDQAADVMNQLFDIFGPPPPVLVPVLVPVEKLPQHGSTGQPLLPPYEITCAHALNESYLGRN